MDKTDDIIPLRPWEANAPAGSSSSSSSHQQKPAERVAFDRRELQTILGFYGTKVAEGEWRDYAMVGHKDFAEFAVFRRSGDAPAGGLAVAWCAPMRGGSQSASGLVRRA